MARLPSFLLGTVGVAVVTIAAISFYGVPIFESATVHSYKARPPAPLRKSTSQQMFTCKLTFHQQTTHQLRSYPLSRALIKTQQ